MIRATEQLSVLMNSFSDQPAIGVGPANFTLTHHTHEIHNTYAAVFAEEGLLGLIAMFVWLAGVLRCGLAGLRCRMADKQRLMIQAASRRIRRAAGVWLRPVFGLRQCPFWFLCGLIAALPRILHTMPLVAVKPPPVAAWSVQHRCAPAERCPA